ncbi:hypothetical protein EYF80_014429 [Liparis tanakae]|uniref:Uncharacterized protein n=1 Tax=Liparis tanakae TaxID=230148 RepID=A0A4Z2IDJ5_9TELE|nr:hypothetical protein EYF80_014429 [Liparis tanakae]
MDFSSALRHPKESGETRAAVGRGLGCESKTWLQMLSVSRRRPPWLREAGQQSRFLCVRVHQQRQRAHLPTHISTDAPEGS